MEANDVIRNIKVATRPVSKRVSPIAERHLRTSKASAEQLLHPITVEIPLVFMCLPLHFDVLTTKYHSRGSILSMNPLNDVGNMLLRLHSQMLVIKETV